MKPPLEEYIPVDVRILKGRPLVRWCYQGSRALAGPMFSRSVEALCRGGSAPQALTPAAELDTVRDRLMPSGFIFHMSRCGSTVVSEMLRAAPRHVVASEPLPVNAVLGLPVPDADRERLLAGVVRALGRRPCGDEDRYFLKLTSWNVLHLPLIRRVFPDVPWIFVYRDPLEVICSQVERPAGWARTRRFESLVNPLIEPGEGGTQSLEMHVAAVLHALCTAALDAAEARMLLVRYDHLPQAVLDRVLPFFGVEPREGARLAMIERGRYYSKDPGKERLFEPDGVGKRRRATQAMREADRAITRAVFNELEELRRGTEGPIRTGRD